MLWLPLPFLRAAVGGGSIQQLNKSGRLPGGGAERPSFKAAIGTLRVGWRVLQSEWRMLKAFPLMVCVYTSAYEDFYDWQS